MPHRIRLRRTRGWRKPDGAVVVSRPSRYGNPWRVRVAPDGDWLVEGPAWSPRRYYCSSKRVAHRLARWLFRRWLPFAPFDVAELRGRDLCCWCPLDLPCHADVLLEVANDPEPAAKLRSMREAT